MADYKVQLQVFEGPLDLLLYLIKKEEVDIYEVNLTRIATQFIAYVDLLRQFDLEIAGEFLVMAATLMYIKSRELLPVDQQALTEGDEDEGLDPRWELIRQLVEYKKFKEMAGHLQERETRQQAIFPHLPGRLDLPPVEDSSKPKVSLFDLLNAVNAILKRLPPPGTAEEIVEDRWTVSEKIGSLLRELTEHPRLQFTALFSAATNRLEVVVIFLALLELVRLKQVAVSQPDLFGEIEITRIPLAAAPAPAPPAAGPNLVASSAPTASADNSSMSLLPLETGPTAATPTSNSPTETPSQPMV